MQVDERSIMILALDPELQRATYRMVEAMESHFEKHPALEGADVDALPDYLQDVAGMVRHWRNVPPDLMNALKDGTLATWLRTAD